MSDDDSSRSPVGLSRREALAATGAAAASLAGCLGILSSGRNRTPAPPSPPDPEVTDSGVGSTATPPGSPTGTPQATGTPTPTPTATPEPEPENYVYVSEAQLRAVAQRVNAGDDPWVAAYAKAMNDADKAMNMSPQSVVDDGAPEWDDPRRFGADKKRHDYRAAIDMTTAVRDTALAYWFTDEDAYARRAIDLLYHWCLDPETGMKPDANIANNGTSIEQYITIPKLWYGASLLRGHPYWTEKTGDDLESAFESWVVSFVDSIPDPGYFQYNNQWAWRIATIAGAASYLDDSDRFEQALCMWRGQCETAAYGKDRPRPWSQYRQQGPDAGFLKRELSRTDGLSYHMYGMKALTMTAEIARQRGIDLYSYNAPTDPGDGPTLKKLFVFMAPYLKSPSQWKWGKGSDGVDSHERNNFAALFELAYARWEEPEFLEVVQTFDRPAYDFWILGWTTLTHARWFELGDS